MAIKHSITLSTTEPNNEVGVIKIRQADEQTQMLEVQITENGVPKSYQGLTVYFCAKLGQTAGLGIIEQKLKPKEMTNPANGKLEYTMRAEDWQILGRQKGYFSFRKMKDEHEFTEQFTTRDFTFDVIKSVYSDGVKEVKKDGSTYIWTLEELTRLFKEYIASGKTNWEEFVEQNRDVLESVDPGGKLLGELIDARKPFGENAFPNLGKRLDDIDTQILKRGDRFKANSKGFLKIPVYNNPNDFQATHPSVLHFPNKFNGYTFWMAYTPYEFSDEGLENPCIVASNDGLKWVVPDGLVNPLAQTDNEANMHYSDTHLVYVNGKLECWYRKKFRGINPVQELIVRKISANGVDWSEEEVLYTRLTGADLLSPVVLFNENMYKIWVYNYKGWFEYFESPTGRDWIKIRDISIPKHPKGYKPWHFDIKFTSAGYEMYYSASNGDYNGHVISYAVSIDNINYTFIDDILEKMPQNIDQKRVYRPCVVDMYGKRFLYYGGTNDAGAWYIGLATGHVSRPTEFTGFEFTNVLPFRAQSYSGHDFVNGILSPSLQTDFIKVGKFGEIKENEIKLVDPGKSEVRLIAEGTQKNTLQVKTGNAHSGILVSVVAFNDSVRANNDGKLRVSGGQLQFFDGNYYQRVSLNVAGSTASRPANPYLGQNYYDTTISRPIWFAGSKWIDAAGNIV